MHVRLKSDLSADTLKKHNDGNFIDAKNIKSLVVYSIALQPTVQFCLCDSSDTPAFYQSDLFDLIDNRLSRFWVFGPTVPRTDAHSKRHEMLTFPEWANTIFFYDDIIESRGTAGTTFRSYRAKMDREFASPELQVVAEPVNGNWLICGSCAYGWEDCTTFEVVTCPECKLDQRRGT